MFNTAGRGVRHAALRAANRRAVLSAITFNPGITNADIARHTGLAPQTASGIVSELDAEGLIHRGEVLRGRRGQPATPLYLNQEAGFAIGCNVGWQHLDMALIDMAGNTLDGYRRDYRVVDAATIADEIAQACARMLEKLDGPQRHKVAGVGLATPGHIEHFVESVGAAPGHGALWARFDLPGEVEARTGLPARRYSNGNCAGWAESALTPPPRPQTFTYLYIGTFIGAALVADHVVWEGPAGSSPNFGSLLVTGPEGEREIGHLVASIHALRKRLLGAGVVWPGGCPRDLPWADFEPHVAPWLAVSGVALAEMIYTVAAVTEIELTIIDGDLPRSIVERLVAETDRAIDKLPKLVTGRPRVAAGRLGSDAVTLGAAHMPLLRKFFESDLKQLHI